MTSLKQESIETVEVRFGLATPTLYVHNMQQSLSYYCEALGFDVQWRDTDRSACVSRGNCTIMLNTDCATGPGTWLWVAVSDVSELFDQYLVAGARIVSPPRESEWGLEMQVEDLSGNILQLASARAR